MMTLSTFSGFEPCGQSLASSLSLLLVAWFYCCCDPASLSSVPLWKALTGFGCDPPLSPPFTVLMREALMVFVLSFSFLCPVILFNLFS